MHAYFSKKIALPNYTKLNCIAWHKIEGYIAIGGDKGLLKVLKLDAGSSGGGDHDAGTNSAWSRGGPQPSNLSMNLTLEGHTEPVQVAVWNENLDKLTTSDSNGVIIVWMLYKGIWYEEMINNRNKSTVSGMAWSFDGSKICIAYADGAVIVGAANGNRIWGKELKEVTLRGVQWSPDGSMLLFIYDHGLMNVYDNQGNFMMRMLTGDLERDVRSIANQTEIVTIQWYDGRYGFYGQNCPMLMVCYQNGEILLFRDVNDEDPVEITIDGLIKFASWNHNASMIAIGSERRDKITGEEKIAILFYDNKGRHLRTLKLLGCRQMTGCAWEAGGLRLAITVDWQIFFANVHPNYMWCYFQRTLVFTNGLSTINGICITFWDIPSSLVNLLYVDVLYCMAAFGNLCVLAVTSDNINYVGKNMLLLCDSGGTIVDEKYTDLRPYLITMNSTLVIVASDGEFCVWQYNNLRSNLMVTRHRDYIYDINSTPTGEEALLSAETDDQLKRRKPMNLLRKSPSKMHADGDIQCFTCNETILLIGRERGIVHHYELPNVCLVNKYNFPQNRGVSQKIRINCNSTKAAWISDGQLIVFRLRSDPGFMRGEPLDCELGDGDSAARLERKDAWDLCWAADNPHMIAVMEKTRLYVFRGVNPEEPRTCSGYLCSFQDLEIKVAFLDNIIANPDNLHKDQFIDMEVKSLRDTRELLSKVGINEARQFIVDNPHPRLWRLLGEAALKHLDLATAEVAYVYCQDLPGIEFINKLKRHRNQNVIKAEVAVYTKDFDEAERLYNECDRKDLVLELYKKLGDWFKVRQLLASSMKIDPQRSKEVYNGIGQYYADRNNWANVKEYFTVSQNNEMLSFCYYNLENYTALEKLIPEIGRKNRLLLKVADMLASVGMPVPAANAYAKYGEINKAIALCAKQNEWELAVNLAKEYSVSEMDTVLAAYVHRLVKDGRLPQGIEVYQKANLYLEAASIAFDYGIELAKTDGNIVKLKKWFVFGAMLVDRHRKENGSSISSFKHDSLIANRWRYALGYHLYGLAQTKLYAGDTRQAFITSAKLREYDDIISERQVYSLLALTSRACEVYSMCSKAFVKLLSCRETTEQDKQRWQDLANDIFKKHPPKDKKILRKECVSCETMIPDWYTVCPSCDVRFPTCLVTGQPLMDPKVIWTCSYCLENADVREMVDRNTCPLCHRLKVSAAL